MKKSTLLAISFTFSLSMAQSAVADVMDCQAQIYDVYDNLGEQVTLLGKKSDWDVERMQLKLGEAARKLFPEGKYADSLQKLGDVYVKLDNMLYERKPKITYEDYELLVNGGSVEVNGDLVDRAGLNDAIDCICNLSPSSCS